MYYARPSSAFGYYRGTPLYGNQGSDQGVDMAGTGVFSAGQGTTGTGSAWTPTVLYLFVLIIVEMFVFAWIARKV